MNRKRWASALLFLFALALPMLWPALGQTPHSITLTWSAETQATGGFNVYRGTTTGGPYTKIGSSPAGATNYVDTTGVAGTQYFYVLTAIDTATPPDESANSNEVSATALGNPPSPLGLGAVSK